MRDSIGYMKVGVKTTFTGVGERAIRHYMQGDKECTQEPSIGSSRLELQPVPDGTARGITSPGSSLKRNHTLGLALGVAAGDAAISVDRVVEAGAAASS